MAKPKSFGIRGIRERCQHLGGNFQITGTPGEGTWANIRIPVNGSENRLPGHATTTVPDLTAGRPMVTDFKNAATQGKAR